MYNDKQFLVDLTFRCMITIDEDDWTIQHAVNELDYKIDPPPGVDNVDVVETEMKDMEVLKSRTDTIKI